MDAQTENLFTEAMKLDPTEREDLAVRLFGSLENEDQAMPTAPEWDEEIARRVEQIRTGKVKTIPAAEVFKRLRAIKDA